MLRHLADLGFKRSRYVIFAAILLVAVAIAVAGNIAGQMTSGNHDFQDPGAEIIAAERQVERATGASSGPSLIVLISTKYSVHSAQTRARISRIVKRIKRHPEVTRTASFYSTRSTAFVAKDGSSTYVAAFFHPGLDKLNEAAAVRIRTDLRAPGVRFGGWPLASHELSDHVSSDLAQAELFALPILFLLSLLFFRGLVAAALPLIVGAVSILTTWLGLSIVMSFTPLSVFSLNLVTGLGLGLAIDYSLFMVSRYREEIQHEGDGLEPLRRTLATAGRTVLFSSITVAAAMAAVLVFPQRFLYSMGIGGVLVTASAAVTSLVLLPAILALLGRRVNSLSLRRWQRAVESEAKGSAGFWYRLSNTVMRRPVVVSVVTATVLIVAGIPFLRIVFKPIDAQVLPASSQVRQVSTALSQHYPPNLADPIYIVLKAPVSAGSQLTSYRERLTRLDGVVRVTKPKPIGHGNWRIDLFPVADRLTDEASELAGRVRGVPVRYQHNVGGAPAWELDQKSALSSGLPLAALILVCTTFIVLFLMTGSILLPLKALLMNVLTLSAAFGILVLIFQDGRLEGLLDFKSNGGLERSQPILLFALAFGLSTDYGVFLLSRIKEARDKGASDRDAVAVGLQRTGRIVTAAALLFSVAIGAFAISQISFVKQLGLGTALAVMIDATVIRALLVPALMALLGKWNWWAPAPLRRLHARLGLQEG